MNRRYFAISLCILLALPVAWAKDKKDKEKSQPPIEMFWPDQTNPTLKLTFEPFSQLATYNGQMSLGSHVLVENLSSKRIGQASFTVYLLDKDKVRVGNGMLSVSDLEGGQQARISFQVMSVGTPSTLSLVSRTDASGAPVSLRTVPLKIVSVPAGAALKVDGQDAGITPVTVRLPIGEHTLSFSKEGYASGTTPVDIKPDEAPGGSITFELGGLSRDNVELRSGKVLQGDVMSVSLTSVVIRVDGQDQTLDRNLVAKIILVQRETVQQPVTAPAQPK
jgi:hypothetical protein